VYRTSITKNSTVAAEAGVHSVKYKMALWHAQWAFIIISGYIYWAKIQGHCPKICPKIVLGQKL